MPLTNRFASLASIILIPALKPLVSLAEDPFVSWPPLAFSTPPLLTVTSLRLVICRPTLAKLSPQGATPPLAFTVAFSMTALLPR